MVFSERERAAPEQCGLILMTGARNEYVLYRMCWRKGRGLENPKTLSRHHKGREGGIVSDSTRINKLRVATAGHGRTTRLINKRRTINK